MNSWQIFRIAAPGSLPNTMPKAGFGSLRLFPASLGASFGRRCESWLLSTSTGYGSVSHKSGDGFYTKGRLFCCHLEMLISSIAMTMMMVITIVGTMVRTFNAYNKSKKCYVHISSMMLTWQPLVKLKLPSSQPQSNDRQLSQWRLADFDDPSPLWPQKATCLCLKVLVLCDVCWYGSYVRCCCEAIAHPKVGSMHHAGSWWLLDC